MRERMHVRPCAQCLHGNVHVIGTWTDSEMICAVHVRGCGRGWLCYAQTPRCSVYKTSAGADLIQRGWIDCENGSRAFVIRHVARPAVM